MAKTREFEWNSPYFNNINESTLKFAKSLLDEGFIKDVYLDENDVVHLIHTIGTGCNFNKDFTNKIKGIEAVNKDFRLPHNFMVENSAGCAEKASFGCTYFGCPIIIAGYLYHNERNLKNDVVKRLCSPKKNSVADFRKSDEEFLEDIMTDDFKAKHADSFHVISSDDTIPKSVQQYFYKTLYMLDKHSETLAKYPQKRPSLNIALIDNTDTSNKICIGQRNCIEAYLKILQTEGFLSDLKPLLEDNVKFVDFKNISENDLFTEENYNKDVIVLHNIYYWLTNITNGEDSNQVITENLVRSGFLEFIHRNSSKKIFIICDKAANLKLLFVKFPQIRFDFTLLTIPDLKVDDVYNLCIKRFRDNSRGLSYSENFEDQFKEYLNENYIYSPYKNLEFVEFIYADAIKNSLLSDHPNEIHIEDLRFFKMIQNAGATSLRELIGLDNVKNEIKNLETSLRYEKEKRELGDKMPKSNLHMCFLGNPGTGKTTVARFMADILFNLEYIRYNKCIECEAKDLIANVPGQTAMKTAEKIQDALGGILFVDEAYAITESEYGKECVAALIKSMEDYRDDLVVILAGYKKEMSQFLELNSGFKSRIAFYFDFYDYSNEELYQMFEHLVNGYGYKIKDLEVRSKIFNILDQEKKMGSGFGNSRYMRDLAEIALRQHAINTVQEKDEEKRYHLILAEDIKRKASVNS